MENKRKEKRTLIEDYFAVREHCRSSSFSVIDSNTHEPVGQLVDISFEGMRIVGNEELHLGNSFSLVVDLSHEINGCKHINVEAWCRWCNKPEKSSHYYAGFKFHTISEKDLEVIDYIIRSCQNKREKIT